MNPLDNLTVCVTNFKRPNYLDRTLTSLQQAGIRRVVVASICGSPVVDDIIEKHRTRFDWLSFDVTRLPDDIGCNNTWMLAAYHSQTERIILMHDDDMLNEAFGGAYSTIISPALDKGVGFATWRASLIFDDGHTEATEFWDGPTRILPARELLKVVAKRGRLSLSPIISVFNRTTLIQACKESEQTLTSNECLHHPGMLLGTEIVVYMRHIKSSQYWLYVDQVLSHYGSHAGSGTIQAQAGGRDTMVELFKGYDVARAQGESTKPILKPKIILVSNEYFISTCEELARVEVARQSWKFHFSQFDILNFPVHVTRLRSAATIGEADPVAFVKDLFDYGCRYAMPEDIVMLANRDVGLTTQAYERIVEGITRGRGVTCCPRRSIKPTPGRHYKHLANCRMDGGIDVFAVTKDAWEKIKPQTPDMLNGREAWDTVFRVLAEEHADQRRVPKLTTRPSQWARSGAYTDHVCWHAPHASKWQVEKKTLAGQIHNRKLGKEFFLSRGFFDQARALS